MTAYGLRSNQRAHSKWIGRTLGCVAIVSILGIAYSSVVTWFVVDMVPVLADKPLNLVQRVDPLGWIRWRVDPAVQHAIDAIAMRVGQAALLGIGCIILVCLWYRKQRRDQHEHLHGSARLATPKDIAKTGLLDNDGVVVGAVTTRKGAPRYLRHDTGEHVLAFAPTGAGKGVSLVIPTLLTWPHSVVVYDLKGENWNASATWRRRHANTHVYRFDPTDTDGTCCRINPMDTIRVNTDHDVADAQNLAQMIMDDDGKGLHDYWTQAGFDFLTGLLLHIAYRAQGDAKVEASLPRVAALVADPDLQLNDVLVQMMTSTHRDNTTHPAVAQAAAAMANKADKEASGVLGTVTAKLGLYRDPIVARNIATSDLDVQDLMNADKPVSLYICVGATDKDRLRPLTRIVFTQILRGLTRDAHIEDGRPAATHRLLLLMDEFASLGRLDVFQDSLAYLRGYGITCYLIVQDLAQLRATYGRHESIMSNCHVRVAFAPNKLDTAEELSKMTGVTTITKKEISESKKGRGLFATTQQSISMREQQRPLLTADEVMRLNGLRHTSSTVEPGDLLVFVAGHPVIYGTQALYFTDPVLRARAALGAPARRAARPPTPAAPSLDVQFLRYQAPATNNMGNNARVIRLGS